MDKIIFITPHLSTGGLPQFLLKKIEVLSDECVIYLIEYENITGGKFVVQRNRIVDLLKQRFYSLGADKKIILDIIGKINPHSIHFEEMPEFFMADQISDLIYTDNRNYKIFETSHDSSFSPNLKRYLPDKFLFVSKYQQKNFSVLGIDSEVIEYPIEYRERQRDREEICLSLGLDPLKKHVLHVGLFTPRKNQKEFFDYANSLPQFEFHSVGNQAENFQSYWKPLMENKPDNVTVWGERDDVDAFYQFCDLFLFTSRGNSSDKETMPLVIRESISWGIPALIYDLPVYESYFDSYPSVSYLEEGFEKNIKKIRSYLEDQKNIMKLKTCIIVDAFISNPDKEKLLHENLESIRKFGHDIILVSHSPVSPKTLEKVDYYLYDKDNSFNDNHVYSWRKDSGVEIRVNIRKSHEWPIIRSMRLAFSTAKSLGYEYFIFTEFDHKYGDSDISKVSDLISNSLGDGKDFVFWAPQEKVDYGGYGDEPGIFYETCFFSGKIKEFMEIFESNFPYSLDEYNSNFSSQFPNSLEYWFWKFFSPEKDRCTIIPNYVKLDLTDSEINVSSYQNFKTLILPSEKNDYLYITNDNFIDYNFEIFFDDKLADSFSLNRFYKLIKLSKSCNIRVKSYHGSTLIYDENIIYSPLEAEEYKKNGQIIFIEGENDIFDVSFDCNENKVYIDYNEDRRREILVSIKDIDSKATIWSFKNIAENKSKWWCVPTPKNIMDYENQINFGGLTVDIYESDDLVFSKDIRLKKPLLYKPKIDITRTEPIFSNYNEFFVDKIYSHLDAQSLGVVFDIGANVGLWTEWILRNNAFEVFCFEPNRTALEVLRRFHGDKENVTIIPKAIDTEIGKINFYYSDSNSLISSGEQHGDLSSSYEVETTTLETIIDQYKISHIDLIKMDIEGAEFKIFENLPDSIYDITDSFLIEFHAFYYQDGEQREQKIISKMVEKGYFIEYHPGGIFASKFKKCFYVNNSSYAMDVPGRGNLEKVNLFNEGKKFDWSLLAKKRQVGYHHAYYEIFFSDSIPNNCIYESGECSIEEGDVVLDIGANIGIFTNYAFRKKASKIISFEPATEPYQALILNSPDNTETYKIGISSSPGIAKIYYDQGDSMSAGMFSNGQRFETVITESLDSLYSKGLFEKIDFLKIDAEGSEIEILNGAEEMLNKGLIKKISMEFHTNLVGDTSSEFYNLLANLGYKISTNVIDENVTFYYFYKK